MADLVTTTIGLPGNWDSLLNNVSNFTRIGANFGGLRTQFGVLPMGLRSGRRLCTISFAKKVSRKRSRRDREPRDDLALEATTSGRVVDDDDDDDALPEGSPVVGSLDVVPSRSAVLQACTVTSGLIAALGIIIRQVSHVASVEGFPVPDCSTEVSFGIEVWHLELILGLVILISSCRYLLLKIWPEFSESTEASNQQVLASLQPSDYLVISFLPGISEELLFHGALQPLFGMDWKSVFPIAILFGVLHLGSGRKSSFAIWATFVGVVYGYATISSSSIIVPMAAHALNNLAGGILWRYKSKPLD